MVEVLSIVFGISGFIIGARVSFGRGVLFGVIGFLAPAIINAIFGGFFSKQARTARSEAGIFYKNALADAIVSQIPYECNSVFIGRYYLIINSPYKIYYKDICCDALFSNSKEFYRFAKKIHRNLGRTEYKIRPHKTSVSLPYATYNSGFFHLHSGGGSLVDGYFIEKAQGRYADLY